MPDCINWTTVPMVCIPPPPRAACPGCGSTSHTIVRSSSGGDGSVTRKAICADCSTPFLVIVDPDLASDWQADVVDPIGFQH